MKLNIRKSPSRRQTDFQWCAATCTSKSPRSTGSFEANFLIVLLLWSGWRCCTQNDWGASAVTLAARGGHTAVLHLIWSVTSKAAKQHFRSEKRTIESISVPANQLKLSEQLISSTNTADPKATAQTQPVGLTWLELLTHTDMLGRTPLAWACDCNQLVTVQWLLRHGAGESVLSPDASGRTCLHWAVDSRSLIGVKAIVDWTTCDRAALLSAQTSEGHTPAMVR